MKTVLITGAGGFIGSHTVKEYCRRGWRVYAMIHRHCPDEIIAMAETGQVKIVKGDISSFDSMRTVIRECEDVPDVIVNCAGRASDVGWEREFRKANYDSVVILGKLTLEYKIGRLVHVSTTDVYGMGDFNGESEDELEYDKNARNNYPRYKIMAEKWLVTNMPSDRYGIVRPAAVWGDNDPTMTKRVRDFLAWSPAIVHFGKWRGANRWPAVHVESVARANYLMAIDDTYCGHAINLLDSEMITAEDFYRMIYKRYLRDRKVRSISLPLWLGVGFGWIVSTISNILNLKRPFIDPSQYAVYSVSSNLNFDSSRWQELEDRYKPGR